MSLLETALWGSEVCAGNTVHGEPVREFETTLLPIIVFGDVTRPRLEAAQAA